MPSRKPAFITFLQLAMWLGQVFSILALLVVLTVEDAAAQDGAPPPSPSWSEVMNSDGTINYGNLTDNGVVEQQADWMPSVFGVPLANAEYHSYTTPTGNQILMPTATTLFFMAMNPAESGYLAAATTLGAAPASAGADAPTGIAGIGGFFGALLGNEGSAQLMAQANAANQNGATDANSFFAALANGQTDIWSMSPNGMTEFLKSFFDQTKTDLKNGNGFNLYTYMLLYPPGACGESPIGCTPDQEALLAMMAAAEAEEPEPILPPGQPNCPAPEVIPGKISFSAQKVDPNYPLVVGQDPDKRGADVQFSASVAPTIYITYEPVMKFRCPGGGSDCEDDEMVFDGWDCVAQQQSFPECIARASGSASLSETSRDWILGELNIRYPGAYLHHPDFGFSGGGGCQWSNTEANVQFADPGYWDLSVSGRTSGTPVSPPRSFGGGAGQFEVWLKEIAIIK